jgi:hypothetical protein
MTMCSTTRRSFSDGLLVINILEESETGTKCSALKGEGVDRQPILLVQMICSHDISVDSGHLFAFWLKSNLSPYIRHRQKDTVFRPRMSCNVNPNAGKERPQIRKLPTQPARSLQAHQEELSLVPRPLVADVGSEDDGALCWRSSPEKHHLCCSGEG